MHSEDKGGSGWGDVSGRSEWGGRQRTSHDGDSEKQVIQGLCRAIACDPVKGALAEDLNERRMNGANKESREPDGEVEWRVRARSVRTRLVVR